ncbi:MAG: protein kinase domain-containing protein, partial [Planctomycetota bacterium]
MSKRLSLDDPRVVRELRAYQEAVEAGGKPDRAELLARFPEIADDLTACLDGLDFVHRIAPQFGEEECKDRDLQPPDPLGDFRIVREVGRGGMGVVYEAQQMSLGRRVALKVLPFAAVLDSRYLQRFKNEAQAAAHLHHTHIVPVHAVGCERGVHYYAMQFIEGSTVAGLIDELRTLAGNGRGRDSSPALEAIAKERTTESPRFCRAVAHLGIQAAEGLDYAHESGVIHRDIKPPNLIVDEKGHLWITDFGLASTRNDTGLTMTGDIIGTLRYMSPEQALAKRVPVDHRTDIYSLAVTLYELLTLKQAFPGDDPRIVMQEIAFKEPTRPRALNPAAPPELETILLKAMSKDPQDRYATAQALSDDLRRFLEDRPIHARRPSLLKRGTQWARRHRPVVWAAAVVLILAVAGLAVVNILLARERDLLAWERDQKAELSEQLRREVVASKEAQARADGWFKKTRQVVDDMVTRVADELEDQPHMEQLRKDLLEKALASYLDFLKQGGDDPVVRAEAARTYGRVGDIYHWLGQPQASVEAYEHAIELREALMAKFPNAPEYRIELAIAFQGLAAALAPTYRFAERERALRRSLSLTEELLATFPAKPAYRRNVAVCSRELGVLLDQVGRPDGAEAAFLRARDVWEALVSAHPEEREHRQGLATIVADQATRLLLRNRFAEAEALLRRYMTTIEELLSEARTPDLRYDHGRGWFTLGNVFERAGQYDEAQQAFEGARSIFDELTSEFPGLPSYASKLANTYRRLTSVYGRLRRVQEAQQAGRDAQRVLGELAKKHPNRPDYRLELAAAHNDLGRLHAMAGQTAECEKEYLRGVQILDGLEGDLGADPYYRYDRANAYSNLGHVLSDRGEAERLYRRSVAMFEKLVDDYRDMPDCRGTLATNPLLALAGVLQSSNRNEEAKGCYRKAIGILQSLVDEYSENPEYRHNLVRSHALFARFYADFAGQPQNAVREYRNALDVNSDDVACLSWLAWLLATCSDPSVRNAREAVKVAQRAVDASPKDVRGWSALGFARYRAGESKEAVEALKQSMEFGSWGAPAYAWLFLAMGHWQLGDKTAAREWYTKAIAWIKDNPGDAELEGL